MKTINIFTLLLTISSIAFLCTGGSDAPQILDGVSTYIVEKGDNIFSIAEKFKIEPETILLSNSETLRDNPLNIKAGLELYIPVVDGALYRWQEGDRFAWVAGRFHVKPDFIIMWVGNHLDYKAFYRGEQITIEPGTLIFIPTGSRIFKLEDQ